MGQPCRAGARLGIGISVREAQSLMDFGQVARLRADAYYEVRSVNAVNAPIYLLTSNACALSRTNPSIVSLPLTRGSLWHES